MRAESANLMAAPCRSRRTPHPSSAGPPRTRATGDPHVSDRPRSGMTGCAGDRPVPDRAAWPLLGQTADELRRTFTALAITIRSVDGRPIDVLSEPTASPRSPRPYSSFTTRRREVGKGSLIGHFHEADLGHGQRFRLRQRLALHATYLASLARSCDQDEELSVGTDAVPAHEADTYSPRALDTVARSWSSTPSPPSSAGTRRIDCRRQPAPPIPLLCQRKSFVTRAVTAARAASPARSTR